MAKIGIVGLGNVGSSIASGIVFDSIATDLYLFDRDPAKSESVALDLSDLSSTRSNGTIHGTHTLDGLLESDVIIISVRADFSNEFQRNIRDGGLLHNAQLLGEIAPAFHGYRGKVIMVTNPVDLMSRYFFERSGLAVDQVFGIGSNLDTQRYRQILSEMYGCSLPNISGRVIGEHGDSMVVLYSSTTYEGNRMQIDQGEVERRLKERPQQIMKGAQRTRYGPAGVVLRTIKRMIGNEVGHEELSTYHNGVFIGPPVRLNGDITSIFPLMDHVETGKFHASYALLDAKYQQLRG